MFLWEERENPTAIRKALEVALATQFSYTLDDQRMLELYLNYAQFGRPLRDLRRQLVLLQHPALGHV